MARLILSFAAHPQKKDLPFVRPYQAEHQLECRSLTCAVAAQVSKHFIVPDLKIRNTAKLTPKRVE